MPRAASICPGSGMQMVPRTYVTRKIEPADRQEHQSRMARAEQDGDDEWIEIIKQAFEEWERSQGQTYERLVCPVCGDGLLIPTRKGTSRPHARRDGDQPSWDRVRHLREDIKALEAELDRQLKRLEPDWN
jgi:hypothetical protein